MYRFEVYQDFTRDWRWRLKAPNGRIIADGSEGYDNKSNCVRALRVIIKAVPDAKLETTEGDEDEA